MPDGERAARRGLRRHQSLGYQVNHAARLLEQELRRRIEALGVVPGQFAALLALYESDGVTQAELGDRVQIEQSTMTKTLVRMERDGLVSRAPDPHDRRRTLVRLTDHARGARAATRRCSPVRQRPRDLGARAARGQGPDDRARAGDQQPHPHRDATTTRADEAVDR